MRSVNLGGGGILDILGGMAGKSQAREKENQQTALEMMKAGFAPQGEGGYQPTYGGQPAGQGLLSSIMGGFRQSDLLDPGSLGAAPWHQASVAAADRDAADRRHDAEMTLKEDRLDFDQEASRRADQIANDELQLRRDQFKSNEHFRGLEHRHNLARFDYAKLSDKIKLEFERQKFNFESAKFFHNKSTGEYFIIQDDNNVYKMQTKGPNAGDVTQIPKNSLLKENAISMHDLAYNKWKTLIGSKGADEEEIAAALKEMEKRKADLDSIMSFNLAPKDPTAGGYGNEYGTTGDTTLDAGLDSASELPADVPPGSSPDVETPPVAGEAVETQDISTSSRDSRASFGKTTDVAPAPATGRGVLGPVGDYEWNPDHGYSSDVLNWDAGLTTQQTQNVNDQLALKRLKEQGSRGGPRIMNAVKDLGLVKAGKMMMTTWAARHSWLYDDDKHFSGGPEGGSKERNAIRQEFYPREDKGVLGMFGINPGDYEKYQRDMGRMSSSDKAILSGSE